MLAIGVGVTVLPHAIELVDEDDRRLVATRLPEKLAHPPSADADEHFGEIAAMNAEEAGVGLTRDGFGQHRLPSSWRPDQQYSLRQASAQPLKLLGVANEIHDFLHLGLGLIDAGHVAKTLYRPDSDTAILASPNVELKNHHPHNQASDDQGRDYVHHLSARFLARYNDFGPARRE